MKIKVSDILRHVLLAFLAVVWLVPIVWLLATSFSKYTGMNTSTFFPKEWAIDSYKNLLFGSDTVAQFRSGSGIHLLSPALPVSSQQLLY